MKKRPSWLRLAGFGYELAAAIVGFSIFGYLIGNYFGSAFWGVLIGAMLGVFGGLYNMVKTALALTRENESAARKRLSKKRPTGNREQ